MIFTITRLCFTSDTKMAEYTVYEIHDLIKSSMVLTERP